MYACGLDLPVWCTNTHSLSLSLSSSDSLKRWNFKVCNYYTHHSVFLDCFQNWVMTSCPSFQKTSDQHQQLTAQFTDFLTIPALPHCEIILNTYACVRLRERYFLCVWLLIVDHHIGFWALAYKSIPAWVNICEDVRSGFTIIIVPLLELRSSMHTAAHEMMRWEC